MTIYAHCAYHTITVSQHRRVIIGGGMEEIKRFRNKNSGVAFGESFHAYRRRVNRLTEAVKHLIPEIDKRGWETYHIDHKLSIYKGYRSGIAAEVIADISNLHLIPYKENLKKGPFGAVIQTK
jgi:hypothetical protein